LARRKKRHPDSAAQTLDELESLGDRLLAWVNENATLTLGVAAGILIVAATWGYVGQRRSELENDSAVALAQALGDYRVAMGATPASIEISEPANPETGRRIRSEYIGRFEQVAAEYAGTTAGALALLEAGKLQQALGEDAAAEATYQRALDDVSAGDPVRGFLLTRLGSVHEAAGEWTEAAEAYAAAAAVPLFPLRYEALADAARSYAVAGERTKALDTFARLESEAPDYRVPPYVEARLSELRDAPSGETP
jgi:tetratricopeptide (TPR) repeat protein